jgi:hypothetical protein
MHDWFRVAERVVEPEIAITAQIVLDLIRIPAIARRNRVKTSGASYRDVSGTTHQSANSIGIFFSIGADAIGPEIALSPDHRIP